QRIGLHAYYPFGTELLSSTTEAPPDNIKFTGHEWDDLGGDIHALTYMHARYYSAALGRFLSVDPMPGNSEAPQSWNRYSYTLNDPLNFTDPSGMRPCNVVGSDGKEHPGECIDVNGIKPVVRLLQGGGSSSGGGAASSALLTSRFDPQSLPSHCSRIPRAPRHVNLSANIEQAVAHPGDLLWL